MSFRTSNDIILEEAALSEARTLESILVTNQYMFAVQASWSNGSSPVMELVIEASLDNQNWVELSSPTISISGASGSNIIQLSEFAYNHLRVKIKYTSGSADLKVVFNAKGI